MELIRNIGYCPHCNNRAPHRLIHTQRYMERAYYMDGELAEDEFESACFVAECETCKQILLYVAEIDIPKDTNFSNAELMWPDPGALDSSVPEKVRMCHEEASRIKNLAPNAFAVQIRRALEAICDDRKAKKGSLGKRLEDLASRGEIPPLLAEITDVLRLLGNIGAHAADQSIKPGHVRAIDEFFRAIVEYVYIAPSKIRAFRERLKTIKEKKEGDV